MPPVKRVDKFRNAIFCVAGIFYAFAVVRFLQIDLFNNSV